MVVDTPKKKEVGKEPVVTEKKEGTSDTVTETKEDVSDAVVKDETAAVEKKEIVTETKQDLMLSLKMKLPRWRRKDCNGEERCV